jgi:hypothetical protein
VAYDAALADRIQDLLEGASGLAEKRMFGALAFLLDGNMAVGVRSDGIIARVGPELGDEALTRPGAGVFPPGGGRPMKGWVTVSAAVLEEDDALAAWIDESVDFARSLQPK